MNKYKKLLSNTFIIGLGTFGSKFLTFCLMRFYTSCLSPAELGDADILTQTANLLIPLVGCGMTDAVFRFAMDRNRCKPAVFTAGLYTVLLGSLLFGAVGMPFFSKIAYFNGHAWLIYFYVVASCVHSVFAQYVRGCGKTRLFAIQGIFSTAAVIGLNLLFLYGLKWTLVGYVLSIVLSDALTSVFLLFAGRLYRELLHPRINRRMWRTMLRYSVPLIPTTVFWWVTNAADRYMVKGMVGDTANGLYGAAYKIPTLLILASGVFIEAWQFSAVTDNHDGRKSEFFGVVFGSYQALIALAAAFLIAFSKVIAVVLFDAEYYTAWRYMPILIIATVFSSHVTFMGSVYLVDRKSMLSMITSTIGAALNFVFNFLLIPVWGPNGAAVATFISYFVVYIIRAVNTQRYLPFQLHNDKMVLNTLLLALQAAAMLSEMPYWMLVQGAAILLIVAFNARPIRIGVKKILRAA